MEPADNPFAAWPVDTTRFKPLAVMPAGAKRSYVKGMELATGRAVAIRALRNLHSIDAAQKAYRRLRFGREACTGGHHGVLPLMHVQLPADVDAQHFNQLLAVFGDVGCTLGLKVLDFYVDWTQQQVAAAAAQLCRAVSHMHNRGVLHGALTPDNVAVTSGPSGHSNGSGGVADELKLAVLDFAQARWLDDASAPPPPISLLYSAPEVLAGGPYTAASEAWAVGCILAEMLGMLPTGNPDDRYERGPLFASEACTAKEQLGVIRRATKGWDGGGGGEGADDVSCSDTAAGCASPSGEDGKAAAQLQQQTLDLEKRYPRAVPEALDLLRRLLRLDPGKRLSVDEALAHPYMASFAAGGGATEGGEGGQSDHVPPSRALLPVYRQRLRAEEVTADNVRALLLQEAQYYTQ